MFKFMHVCIDKDIHLIANYYACCSVAVVSHRCKNDEIARCRWLWRRSRFTYTGWHVRRHEWERKNRETRQQEYYTAGNRVGGWINKAFIVECTHIKMQYPNGTYGVQPAPYSHTIARCLSLISFEMRKLKDETQKILRHRFTFVSNKIIGWNRFGNSYARTRRMHIAIEYLPMDYSNFNSFFLFDRRWEVRRLDAVRWNWHNPLCFLSVFHFGAFSTPVCCPSFASNVGISRYNIRETIFSGRFFFIISETQNASEYSTKIDEW